MLGSLLTPGFLASFHIHAAPLVFLIHYATALLIGGLIGGPFLEEWGWRGFALPRMQRRQSPVMASLVLGVLWALWHTPFFLPGYFGLNLLQIGEYILSVILFTIMITWVFNNTRGSLLLAFLVHASIDAAVRIFPAPIATSIFPVIIGFGVLSLLLIALTRGHLSYERNLREVLPPAPKAVVHQEPVAPGKSV